MSLVPPTCFPAPDRPTLPRWSRQAMARDDAELALFSLGAALAVLDPLARSEDPVGQL